MRTEKEQRGQTIWCRDLQAVVRTLFQVRCRDSGGGRVSVEQRSHQNFKRTALVTLLTIRGKQ